MNEDQLLAFLVDMFPDAPFAYLAEHCPDLVGKPAAIERYSRILNLCIIPVKSNLFLYHRFIDQLTASNSNPPENWTPGANDPANLTEQLNNSIEVLEQVRKNLFDHISRICFKHRAIPRLTTPQWREQR